MKLTSCFLLFLCSLSSVSYGQFSPEKPLTIDTSSEMTMDFLQVIDLDGDGDNDILGSDMGSIFWFETIGDTVRSGLQMIAQSPTASYYGWVATDVDGDGDFDVVYAEYLANKISWSQNLGGGVFAQSQLLALTHRPSLLISADFDNNGANDVISISDVESGLLLYRNLGDGTFATPDSIQSNLYPLRVASGDIDQDGLTDIVATYASDTVVGWTRNLGNAAFAPVPIPLKIGSQYASELLVADLDNNGTQDVVYGIEAATDTISYRVNTGNGNFLSEDTVTTRINSLYILYSSDLDSDGLPELFSVSTGKIAEYHKLAGGGFLPQTVLYGASGAVNVGVGDMNGDGNPDLVTSTSLYHTAVQLNTGGALGPPSSALTVILTPRDAYIEDLDGDGIKDILVAGQTDNRLYCFRGLGGGSIGSPRVIATNVMGATSVFCIDLDGDGDNDVLSASQTDAYISWYENTGNGNVGPRQILASDASYSPVVKAADIDNDGDQDVVYGWCNGGPGMVKWIENAGNGSFGATHVVASVCSISIQITDFDGDGWKDIVSSAGSVIWFKNTGNGVFDGGHVISTQNTAGEKFVTTGDIDNDGDIDIVATQFFSSSGDNIVYFKNSGSGVFSSDYLITTSVNRPKGVALKDLDNDGDPDVAWCDQWSPGNVAWIENLGNDNWGAKNTLSVTVSGASSIATGDIDDDGDIDLLVTGGYPMYQTDNAVKLFENLVNNPFDLKGHIYYDANQNGIRDNSESGFSDLAIASTPTGPYAFTYEDGRYLLNFSGVNVPAYEISPVLENNWMITSDSLSYHVLTSQLTSYGDTLDFGLYPSSSTDSVAGYLTGGFPRCNSIIPYWISIENKGTTIPSGVVHLTLSDGMTYVSSSETPDSIVGQEIYWTYSNLFFFSNKTIVVDVQTPPSLPIDSMLVSSLELSVFNNSNLIIGDTLSHPVRCAYDPNDKIVTPAGTTDLGLISPETEQLEYVVRFQNTGTDTAALIVVKDQLSSHIDWESVTVLASSHPVETSVSAFGEITFRFADIDLPDSNANYIASCGFVRFTVRLKPGLAAGVQILNDADIYFDYNPAVVTNTAINTIYGCGIHPEIPYLSATCQSEEISFEGLIPGTDFSWQINGGPLLSGQEFQWTPGTAGTYSIDIHIQNAFCSVDTTATVTINGLANVQLPDLWLCAGDTTEIFGMTVWEGGLFSDTLQTSHGCDSIVQQSIHFYDIVTPYQLATISVCPGDSLLVLGTYRTEAGTYYRTFQNIHGCDSVVSQSLAIYHPEVIFQTIPENSLCQEGPAVTLPNAQPPGGVYSGPGVTGNIFDPALSGIGIQDVVYQAVDSNGCVCADTLVFSVASCLSLSENSAVSVSVYPNPASDVIYFRIGGIDSQLLNAVIFDLSGRIVFEQKQLPGGAQSQITHHLSSGSYRIVVSDRATNEVFLVQQLVIE